MKISLAPQQYFDLEGNPLVSGRLKIYLHGSDTLANTYILTGNDFVEGPNPVILDDAGEQQNTIFMEAAIYDISVEKLVDGQYAKISDFQFGFVMPTAKNDTIVNGIDALGEADTDLGFVTVVGYDNITYAGPRTYMWDSMCTEDADGGCIIESQVNPNGRWLLLSDLREMPCTYYGIEAGRENNMAAFLTYLPVVGTFGIFMPPVPRFLKGDYLTEGTIGSTKVLSFDQGARFKKAYIQCVGAEVTPSPNYVADFFFTGQQLAESSWFRSVSRFWKCGARELHQSRYNYFEDTDVGNYGSVCAILMNQTVSGTPLTFTGAANLEFNHCNIANYSLSTNWYTVFKNCDFSDKWFNDANWNIGTSITFRQVVRQTENRIILDNFADANVYVLAMAANGATSIDLQNRPVSTITTDMPFRNISNGNINEAHFNAGPIYLNKVSFNSLNFENNNITVNTNKCSAVVYTASCATWNDDGSTFVLGCDVNTYYTTINWTNTGCDMNSHRMGRLEDDLYTQKQPVFWRCAISNGVIASSSPIFLECNIANTPIYVYPCSIIEDLQQSWTMTMEFRKNRFNGSSTIAIGANNGYSDHLAEVYECAMTGLAITDNVFNTTVAGITCPFWSGTGLAYRFIRGLTTFDNGDVTTYGNDWFPIRYEYRDNDGNCPRAYGLPTGGDLPGARAIAANWGGTGAQVGTGMYFENGVTANSVFVLPALLNPSKEPIPDPTYSGSVYSVDRRCVCTPYRAKALFTTNQQAGLCADYPLTSYLPLCACDKSLPNDMFNCLVGAWGESAQFFGVNPIGSGQ